MLHNETRNLLIQAYNKTHNAKEVAECFSVDVSTVYRLVEQMKREGSVSVKTSLRGRKASLKEADLQKIQELVQQKPDITLQEIIDTFQLKICIETVRKALIKLGYSYKKKSLHASEQERPRCQGKTQKLEKTYVGERHKSSGLSGRKRSKHQYDATLCQSMEKPESSR